MQATAPSVFQASGPGAADLREWLARELHDRVAGSVGSMLIELEQLRRQQIGSPGVRHSIEEIQDTARECLEALREVTGGIRSGGVADFGDQLRAELEKLSSRSGLDITVRTSLGRPPELPAEVAYEALRVVEESVRNVWFHARASSVVVALDMSDRETLEVSVRDDGAGVQDRRRLENGTGVAGMRERARLVGGTLDIDSAPGRGTTVWLRLPVSVPVP